MFIALLCKDVDMLKVFMSFELLLEKLAANHLSYYIFFFRMGVASCLYSPGTKGF